MRHDYNFPPDWDAMSTQEKSDWMTRERCRRQAERQGFGSMEDEKMKERLERRLDARPDTIDVDEVDENTFIVNIDDEEDV